MLKLRISPSLDCARLTLSATPACSGAVEMRGEAVKERTLTGVEISFAELIPAGIVSICEMEEPAWLVRSMVDVWKTRYPTERRIYLTRRLCRCPISRCELTI